MKKHYEGSISQPGTEDWSEPCDLFAAAPEIAAKQLVEWQLSQGEIEENQTVNICVREITVKGIPVTGWEYLTGKAMVAYTSEVTPVTPAPP